MNLGSLISAFTALIDWGALSNLQIPLLLVHRRSTRAICPDPAQRIVSKTRAFGTGFPSPSTTRPPIVQALSNFTVWDAGKVSGLFDHDQ